MAITSEDWRMVKQHYVQVMMEVVAQTEDNEGEVIDETRFSGIVNGGSINIDSGSSVRRTASFSLVPTENLSNINEESLIWLDKKVLVSIGILDQRRRTGSSTHNGYNYTGKYRWWKMGTFLYTNANLTFDASTYTLSIELSDFVTKLDGTTNGQLGGALTHVYAAYEEDPDTGQPIAYSTIKGTLRDVLKSAHVHDMSLEEVGEFYAFKRYNPNGWQQYRQEHPLWNKVPYDLEFSIGSSVWDIITELTQLYPNYDAAYDENGVFRVEMIPSVYEEENDFFYEDYADMIISEQSTTDLTGIHNVCEVWGESLDANGYAEGTMKGAEVSYYLYTETVDNQYKVKGYESLSQSAGENTGWSDEIDFIVFQNVELTKEYTKIRITYDRTTLRVIATDKVMWAGTTYNAGDVIASCEYGGVLFPSNPGFLFSSIPSTYDFGRRGRFVMLVDGYKEYRDGDRFGVKFGELQSSSTIYEEGDFMCINNLEPLGIVDASTGKTLQEGVLDEKHIHVFQLVRIYRPEFDDYNFQWWYVGVSQSHALDVLTNGELGEWIEFEEDGKRYFFRKYSEDYFKYYYNCDTVTLTYCPDSPYVVQKIGERVDVKTEGEFNNIRSNVLASERAQYENWKNSRMTDNVTITTKLMPFVKPYMKIDYKKHGTKRRDDYIIQSVSHDFENGTTSIQMYTFYPLYKAQPGETDRMTYKYMGGFLNGDLHGNEDQR